MPRLVFRWELAQPYARTSHGGLAARSGGVGLHSRQLRRAAMRWHHRRAARLSPGQRNNACSCHNAGVRMRSNAEAGPLPPGNCDLSLPFIESQIAAVADPGGSPWGGGGLRGTCGAVAQQPEEPGPAWLAFWDLYHAWVLQLFCNHGDRHFGRR